MGSLVEQTIGSSICSLARLCKASEPPLPPHSVLEIMRRITKEGRSPFQSVENSLFKTQSAYMECIKQLKQLPEGDKIRIHELILSQMTYHRFSSFLPLIDAYIKEMQGEVEENQGNSKTLQNQLSTGIGNKQRKRTKREQILSTNISKINNIRFYQELRDKITEGVQAAKQTSNIIRTQLKKSSSVDMNTFKAFEKIVQIRERLKVQYFFSNRWFHLILNGKVQDAFDSILRNALPAEQLSLCQRISQVFRSIFRCSTCLDPLSR